VILSILGGIGAISALLAGVLMIPVVLASVISVAYIHKDVPERMPEAAQREEEMPQGRNLGGHAQTVGQSASSGRGREGGF
jgi:hypothetical protein